MDMDNPYPYPYPNLDIVRIVYVIMWRWLQGIEGLDPQYPLEYIEPLPL
jgi:hypothetical protein